MTNDLVARLCDARDLDLDGRTRREAADRIEALERTLGPFRATERLLWRKVDRIAELEEALGEIAKHETSSLGGMWYRDRARRALDSKP